MDLDCRAYSKLIDENNTYGGSEKYIRILDAILPLTKRCDHETPEMWCSRICDPFRKILEDSFLRMDILQCMETYMRLIVGNTVRHQITYIVVYATP